MKQIISIGGGGFTGEKPSLKIERYLLAQTQKSHPKICFLAQASAEDPYYTNKFFETFLSLDAKPSQVSLFGRVENKWKDHILDQDLIYVGGGNTKSMLALWREWGMDKILKQAYEQGIVLSGLSAGAICWFEQAITDSVWPLGSLTGLGFLKGSCCPHYDSEKERKPAFNRMVQSGDVMPGIALEDGVAAHYINGKLEHIIRDTDNKNAYFVSKQEEEIISLHSA